MIDHRSAVCRDPRTPRKVGTPRVLSRDGLKPTGRAGEATALQGGQVKNAFLAVADSNTAKTGFTAYRCIRGVSTVCP